MVEHRTEPLLNIEGMQVFWEVDNFHPLARERTQATGRPLVGRVEMRSVRYRLEGGVGCGDHVSLFIDNDNHFHIRPPSNLLNTCLNFKLGLIIIYLIRPLARDAGKISFRYSSRLHTRARMQLQPSDQVKVRFITKKK